MDPSNLLSQLDFSHSPSKELRLGCVRLPPHPLQLICHIGWAEIEGLAQGHLVSICQNLHPSLLNLSWTRFTLPQCWLS